MVIRQGAPLVASLLLATAAVVTGGDRRHIARLPDTRGLKNEVLLQKAHHSCYDNQLTDVGVRLIEVETAADIKRAVNERTAMMFFMNKDDDPIGDQARKIMDEDE